MANVSRCSNYTVSISLRVREQWQRVKTEQEWERINLAFRVSIFKLHVLVKNICDRLPMMYRELIQIHIVS